MERANLCRVVQHLEVCVRSVVLAFDIAIRAGGTQSIVAMRNTAWSKNVQSVVYDNKQNTARKNGHSSHWQPVSRKAQKTPSREPVMHACWSDVRTSSRDC